MIQMLFHSGTTLLCDQSEKQQSRKYPRNHNNVNVENTYRIKEYVVNGMEGKQAVETPVNTNSSWSCFTSLMASRWIDWAVYTFV